jgi:hypothetical protein
MLNRKIRIFIIPFLTPRLSSYWIDLVTPVSASLARPLIDSLKHEAIVQNELANRIIPFKLKSFEQSISDASKETIVISKRRTNVTNRKERTSKSINMYALVITLFALASIGSVYYYYYYAAQIHQESFQLGIVVFLLFFLYLGIAFALYFLRYGARLGAFVAGIIGWGTLALWLFEEQRLFFSTATGIAQLHLFSVPNTTLWWLDTAGVITSTIIIVTSHNLFHKIRLANLEGGS